MTRPEFKKIADVLAAGLDREIPKPQMEIWFQLLERFPAEAVRAAVLRHLSESTDTFVPAPGVIVRMACEAMVGVAEAPESAYRRLCLLRISWGDATDVTGRLLVLDHIDERLWKAVESAGGWERFCGERSSAKEAEFAQFRDSWNRMAAQEARSLALPAAIVPAIQGPTTRTEVTTCNSK